MATCSPSVLLGVCDSPCYEPVLSPYENKIGGYPDFFPSSSLSSLPCCSLCGGCLQLLVQVYCPLEGSINHRLLHLYCCPISTCDKKNDGWLALRSELKDETLSADSGLEATTIETTADTIVNHSRPPETTANHSRPPKTIANHSRPPETTVNHSRPPETIANHSRPQETKQLLEWCSGADDWGDEDAEEDGEKEEIEKDVRTLTQSMDDIQLSDPPKMQAQHAPKETLTGPYFVPMYMNVVEEPTTSEHSDMQKAEDLLHQYKLESRENFEVLFSSSKRSSHKTGDDKRRQGSGSEMYEKTLAKHGDRTFQKFKKRLSLYPGQVLRYCWKGEPLLISDSNQHLKVTRITCKTCGSQCVFEFQLMPPLIYLLQQSPGREREGGSSTSWGLDFGTVAVYSCSESCWSERERGGFREESVLVIADPETELLSKLTKLSVN